MSCTSPKSVHHPRELLEEAYNVAPAISVDVTKPTLVTASGAVPNWAVPPAGLKVKSASFWTIEVRVTRDPLLPTPTPTNAVAAVLIKTSEYQTILAPSAMMTQPPQVWPAVVVGSSAGPSSD